MFNLCDCAAINHMLVVCDVRVYFSKELPTTNSSVNKADFHNAVTVHSIPIVLDHYRRRTKCLSCNRKQ